MLVGLAAGIAAFCVLVAILIVAMPSRARADAPTNCQPVDPASIVYTHMGWSIAQGDGHVYIPPGNVVYHDGPLMVCMPKTGMLRLYLPSSGWLRFARYETAVIATNDSRFITGGWLVNAHFEYAWINDGNYKAKNGTHCCGMNDCKEIAESEVRERNGMSDTPFGPVDPKGVYQSRDGKVWVCRRHWPYSTAEGSCLFIPGGG